MIMERYLNIFARIPPLPIYYDILDAIRWVVYTTDEFEEYEFYDSIVHRFISWGKSTYDVHSIQRVIRELIDLFIELGWIKRKLNKLKIKERIEIIDFFKLLRNNFKHTITRLVAWAVWYIYNRKGSNFKLSELLQVLPRDFNKEYIIKILKRLRVEVYDENISLNEFALQKIIKTLEDNMISHYWPVFSILYVKNTNFFKILGGKSCRTYVDVPNFIYEDLISRIAEIDHKSTTSEEFFAAASKVIQYYNEMVLSEYAREAIGTSIDWLSYELRSVFHLEEKDYGLGMRIKWKKFMEFLEEYAQSDVELWKKYRYITSCKILAADLAKRQQYDFESVAKKVKMIAEKDMDHIKKLLDEVTDIIEIAKNNLIRFEKAIYRKYKDYIPSLTRIYLLEMKSEVKAAKSFVDHGIPSMWYRTARTIIENLAWSIFEDILCFKTLKTGYPFERYYFDINIEWIRKARNQQQPSNIKNAKDKIRKDFLRGIKTIKHEKELKDLITEEILKNMSYPLFIALFGLKSSDKNEKIQIPMVHRDYIIRLAQESLRIILSKLNVENRVIEELTKKLESLVQEEKLVPPLPTHRFVLEFVDNALSTNFYKLWDSYSFFVHSNFASWHIIPFTSVLEFKILKNELMKFLRRVSDAFNALMNVLKN